MIRVSVIVLALSGCAQIEAPSVAPAAMQVRTGATVSVDGVSYEVRRANVRFAIGAAPIIVDLDGNEVPMPRPATAEAPDGEPAVVVSGIGALPGGWAIAERAIGIACGFDIEAEGAVMGLGFEQGTQPGGTGTDIFYPLTRCPALDG